MRAVFPGQSRVRIFARGAMGSESRQLHNSTSVCEMTSGFVESASVLQPKSPFQRRLETGACELPPKDVLKTSSHRPLRVLGPLVI